MLVGKEYIPLALEDCKSSSVSIILRLDLKTVTDYDFRITRSKFFLFNSVLKLNIQPIQCKVKNHDYKLK